MVNDISSGFSELDEKEKGCSVSEKGVFQSVIQANCPGLKSMGLFLAERRVTVQLAPRSSLRAVTLNLFRISLGG